MVIIGLNHDGHGCRAIRVSDGTVLVSVHIKVHPDLGTARTLLDKVSAGVLPSAAVFVNQHCNCGETFIDVDSAARGGHLVDLVNSRADAEAAKEALPPLVQQVGNPPGHGGSRASLRPRVPPAELRAGSRSRTPSSRASSPRPPIYDQSTTRALLRDARAAGQVLRWRPGFTKTGKSGERYQFYSKAKTFAQFDALTKETYLSGITGTPRPKATRDDLFYDAARGIVTFVDADTLPALDQAVVDSGDSGGSVPDDASAREDGDTASGSDDDTDPSEDARTRTWRCRVLPGPPQSTRRKSTPGTTPSRIVVLPPWASDDTGGAVPRSGLLRLSCARASPRTRLRFSRRGFRPGRRMWTSRTF